MTLICAARSSKLSKAQLEELKKELASYSSVAIEGLFSLSYGDKDLAVSLKDLEKTDFFTRDIDELVISGLADFALHSAKDLPEVLDPRLVVIAITQGVNPQDALVSYRYTLATLPEKAVIGACSHRRIEGVKQLRDDLIFKDIRGPIDERIKLLEKGHYDAIILAEAGLIRLGLDVPRQLLNIPVAPLQGKLAVVALKSRHDLKTLFSPLDTRVCGFSRV